jgi:hypothetical protein
MATSVGGGIARGLETGFGLGLRLQDRDEQKRRTARQEQREDEETLARREERTFTRERLTKQDDRQAVQDERQALQDALKAMDEEGKGLTGEMAGYLRAAGGDSSKLDPTIKQDYTRRAGEFRQRKSDLLRKQYDPVLSKMRQEAQDIWSRVETGQIDLSEVPPDKLYQALTVVARRDPADLMPDAAGGPSKVTRATQDILTGMKTKNEGMQLAGWNLLMEPELKVGVGQPGKDGSEILRKEIIKIVPHPTIPGRVLPVIRVYVRREDGATGSYVAPITKGRRADDDEVTDIDINEAMDYTGRMQSLAEALKDPVLLQSLEEGRKTGGPAADEYMQAFFAMGGQPPKMTTQETPLGDRRLLRTMDESGREVKREELKVGATPRAPVSRTTGVTGRLQAIEDYAAEHDVSNEEAARALQDMGVIPRPRAPTTKITESEQAGLIKDAKRAIAGQMGLTWDTKTSKWRTQDGKPANENQVASIEAAGAEVVKRVRDQAAKGERTSATEVIKAGEGAAAAAPNKKLAPASFKASGRDAKADFETVANAVAKGANPNQLAANLAKAGYSSQSINEALAAAGVKVK